MSVWDQHDDFLAEQAALLATKDALEAQGLLELMRNAYKKARHATRSKYSWLSGKVKVEMRDGQGRQISPPYQSIKDPLPEDGLYSTELQGHIGEIFDCDSDSYPDWHEAMIDHYESWENDKLENSRNRFEVQRFSREEISRWLQLRNIQSAYSFLAKIEASHPQIKPVQIDRSQPEQLTVCVSPLETQDLGGVEPHKTEEGGMQSSPQAKGRTWLDKCGDYVAEVQRTGSYGTAKDLYKALQTAAKAGQGPFEIGQGHQRGSLVIKETGKTVSFKTLQNQMAEILKRARLIPRRPNRSQSPTGI